VWTKAKLAEAIPLKGTVLGGSNPLTATKFMKEKYVYVLKSDGDGTLHSVPSSFGVAVDTVEEAKRFVEEAEKAGWCFPCYAKVRIFSDKDEGIKWAYSEGGPMHV